MPVPSTLSDRSGWRQVQWFAPWRVALTLLIIATIWGFVDVRRRGYPYPETPGEHKSDLTVYTEAGAAFFDGRPPYEVRNPRGWTYVYPPMLAMILAPLHSAPTQNQVMVWFFICLAMCWGSYRECARIVAAVGSHSGAQPVELRTVRWLGVIALITAALPTLNCLQRGQVTIVIVYFLLLGTRLVLAGRTRRAQFLGGVLLAVPVVIKIVPVLPVAFLLFVELAGVVRNRGLSRFLCQQEWDCPLYRRGEQESERNEFRSTRRRNEFRSAWGPFAASSSGFALGLLLVFLLLPAALVGWNANLRHLDTWSDLVLRNPTKSTATPGFENDTHSVRNQCLGNALYRLGNFGAYLWAGGPEEPLVDERNPPPRMMDAPSVDYCLLVVRATLLLALLLVGLRLSRDDHAVLSQAAGFGLACAVLLVVSPVARNHYFILLVPGVLFVPLWLAQHGGRRAAMVMAVVPCILVLLQYFFLPYVGRVGLLGLGTAAWVMFAMVLLVRADRCRTGTVGRAQQPVATISTPVGCAA